MLYATRRNEGDIVKFRWSLVTFGFKSLFLSLLLEDLGRLLYLGSENVCSLSAYRFRHIKQSDYELEISMR